MSVSNVNFIDSQVVAIGNTDAYSGVVGFDSVEPGLHLQVSGGTLYLKNNAGGYDLYPDFEHATATDGAVIFYGGAYYYLIAQGDNVQYVSCTYNEADGTIITGGTGYMRGSVDWNENIVFPARRPLRLGNYDLVNGKWADAPATFTIPQGKEVYVPDNSYLFIPGGSDLVVNGTLTCPYISSNGAIKENGTLNSLVLRGVMENGTPCYSYTAHGDATFYAKYLSTGLGSITNNTQKGKLTIPTGKTLTIPAGETLDATVNGITASNLSDYYINSGTLVVNGTAKFPAGTTLETIGKTAGTGSIIIDSDTYHGVSVTGGTADKTFAKAGETITLTPGGPGKNQRFKNWSSSDVTISGNTFTMPTKPVTVTAEYDTVYTVSFDGRGGSGVDSQTVIEGQTASKPAVDPTRTGYQFDGWYSDAECTKPYDFTAATTSDITLYAKWLKILPAPPASSDGKQYQLVMEEGLSEVPQGLKGTYKTTEALQTALKTELTKLSISEDNTAVYDVKLMVSTDGGKKWEIAKKENFPTDGKLTVTLPYPATTDKTYTFTMVHMFTIDNGEGKQPGDTETPAVTNTADGIQFQVTGLSPISVGWTAPAPKPSGSGGGGGGSSTYAVTVEETEHGKVASDRRSASKGAAVTLTVTPDEGYVLDTLTVTDSRGKEIELTAKGGNRYTFTMPGGRVYVEARFVEEAHDCPAQVFADLDVTAWYHEAVDYVLSEGLMDGYRNGLFGPNDTLSRAQLAQILYSHAGRPAVSGSGPFTDTADGAWYADAVAWAAAEGIVSGYGNGRFGPGDPVTREQLAVMLYRCAGKPVPSDPYLNFADADRISGYALNALRWAVEEEIISGCKDGRLDPRGQATRAQAAAMVQRYLKKAP